MTTDPLFAGLKYGFLAVLYIFVIWIARSSTRDVSKTRRILTLEPEHDGYNSSEYRALLRVVLADGLRSGSVFDISEGATLGRSSNVEICLNDDFSSSKHARITPEGGVMVLNDLKSTNGTYLNGKLLKRSKQLHNGDSIRIGNSEFVFEE